MNTNQAFRDRVNDIARHMPGAELTHPFDGDHDAWKVRDKMFTCIGAKNPGVSVKTPDIDTARMLIDAGVGIKAPYFHRSWLHLTEDTDDDELRHRIEVSYDTVRSGLTKKAQAELPPRQETN